ncbi:hypothetical protein HPB52_003127 [Rhipicephalus sanguineus]|uniref:CCHC-type domain-containing protein n=1 Tax=Rhipicephalus sanguineus TaxID=34632 RepID=A0A9D4STT6_RHISA|nr:hypothetical protein HPB52_003127 [Rhipicephalus sanguineus]
MPESAAGLPGDDYGSESAANRLHLGSAFGRRRLEKWLSGGNQLVKSRQTCAGVHRLHGRDSQLIGIARCKVLDAAHDFAWRDDNIAAATAFPEFRALALERFDTELLSSKVERFRNARQNAGEDACSFANCVQLLGTTTLAGSSGEDSVKAQLWCEILAEQMLSRFLTGLRDSTFDEAIDVAAGKELNEKLSRNHMLPVQHVEENADAHGMRSRLDHLEKLLEKSLKARDTVREEGQGGAARPLYPGGCFNCDGFGHFWRECN